MNLTDIQVRVALIVLAERPPVIPDTCVIINEVQKVVWYNQVGDAMKMVGIKTREQVNEFCNLAGVPN